MKLDPALCRSGRVHAGGLHHAEGGPAEASVHVGGQQHRVNDVDDSVVDVDVK